MSGPLAHSPARIVSRVLVQRGYASSPVTPPSTPTDWSVFVGLEPDLPDRCITIRNTTGNSFGYTQPDGRRQTHYGIQIRIRARTEEEGYERAHNIAIALDEEVLDDEILIGSSTYKIPSITRTSDVFSLGKEPQSRRSIFTINATVDVYDTQTVIDFSSVLDDGLGEHMTDGTGELLLGGV